MRHAGIRLMTLVTVILAASIVPVVAQIVAKGTESNPCDGVTRIFYAEARVDPGGNPIRSILTIRNTGDCAVFFQHNGRPIGAVDKRKSDFFGVNLLPGDGLTAFCALGRGTCSFTWKIR